jgi:hypothetical protein
MCLSPRPQGRFGPFVSTSAGAAAARRTNIFKTVFQRGRAQQKP